MNLNEVYSSCMESQQQSSEKDRIFTERLTSRINRLGIQENELAARVGVEPSAVNNWTKGRNAAKGRNLRRLAEVLNCDPGWLSGENVDVATTLRDEPSRSETEIWKSRAVSAEKKLADLRSGLRSLLDLSSDVAPLSSVTETERRTAAERAAALEEAELRARQQKSPVDVPNGEK